MLSNTIFENYLKNNQITMKTKRKMKNKSYRYDINRPNSRHGHKYSTYKKCLWWYLYVLSNN